MSRTFKCSLPYATCFNCFAAAEEALRNSVLPKISSVSYILNPTELTIIVEDDKRSSGDIIADLTRIISGFYIECEDFKEVLPLERGEAEVVLAPAMIEVVVADPAVPAPETVVMEATTISLEKKRVIKRKRISPLASNLIKAGIGILSGAAIMALMLSGVAIPAIAMYVMVGVTSLLTLILGAQSYKEATLNLATSGTWTMDVLYAVSSLAIIGTNIASLFFPFMPMMMDAGLLIFGFKFGGKALEEYIRSKTSKKLPLAERAAKKVWRRMENGDWVLCDSGDIKVGDIIRVNHGEKIPVNGVLESEHAWLGVSIEDGATDPKYVQKGKIIYAGMDVPEPKREYGPNEVMIRVTHTRENSYYAALENARDLIKQEKSPLEDKAQKALKFLVPIAVGAAVVGGVLIGVFMSPALGMHFATSLLVSLCPCTLGVLTPTSMTFGIKKAENHGVRFKDSNAIEQAANIDIVVFDLTATLTKGNTVVNDYEFYDDDGRGKDHYLGVVAAIQRKGRHIFALKIAAFAEGQLSGKKDHEVFEVRDEDHTQNTGIKAVVDGDEYLIGNSRFLQSHQIELPQHIELKGVEQITYVVKNGRIIGHFIIEDPLRPDACFVVNELRQMGKEVRICTGASEETALRYARALNIPPEHVYADAVAEENPQNSRTKLKYIKQLQALNKRVSMVGDGGNDSEAVAQSNFGLALNSTATDSLTRENAGATIPNASLLPVVTSFVVAQQTMRSARQNLIFSLTYNLAAILILGGVLIGIGFAINPAVGVALMVVQASLILLNQYRIYKQKMPHIQRYSNSLKNDFVPDDASTDMFRRNGLMGSPELRAQKKQEAVSKGGLANERQPLLSPQPSPRNDTRGSGKQSSLSLPVGAKL